MKKALILSIPITLIGIVLSLGFRIYLAHNYDIKTQAYYYTVVDLTSLMGVVFIGFRSSMTVAYQKTKDSDKITMLFLLPLCAATIFSVAFLSYPIHLFVDNSVKIINITMLFLAFATYVYCSNRLAMFRLYKSINTTSILESPVLIACFFTIVSFDIPILESLIFAVIAQNIILAAYIKLSNIKQLKEPNINIPKLDVHAKEYLKNSALSSMEFVFGIAFIYLGIFCAKLYFSLEDLGVYQIVIKPIFMYAVMLFVFPIVKFVFPEVSMLVAENRDEEINSIAIWVQKYALIATFALISIIIILGQNGINAIFGDGHKSAFLYLVILMPAIYFAIMNAFYISLLKANGNFKGSLMARASSLVFFVAIFSILEQISSTFLNVIISISMSYFCINILSKYIVKKVIPNTN